MLKAVCDSTMKGPIIYVRHAQTTYNTFSEEAKQSKQIRLEEQFLDCVLSEDGRKQAQNFYDKIKDYDIKYCFVSPLARCLETSYLALSQHKDADDIQVFVHPLLNEIISSTQTITSSIKAKKDRFSETSPIHYNWSIFDSQFKDEEDQDFYYLNFVDNKIVETQAELIREIKESPKPGQISKFLGAFWQHGFRPETFKHLYQRASAFKKYLVEFAKEKPLKENEKILVFTHLHFIRMSTSNIANTLEDLEEIPHDGFCPKNCESVSCIIEDE